MLSVSAIGQQSPDKIWTITARPKGSFDFKSPVNLIADRTVLTLNQSILAKELQGTPKEFAPSGNDKGSRITLPTPDGGFITFQIQDSPIFEEDSARNGGAQIRTYRGIGIDDATASARFEVAPDGFHAIVRSSEGTFYVDPDIQSAPRRSPNPYISHFSGPAQAGDQPTVTNWKKFNCVVTTPSDTDGNKPKRRPLPAQNDILQDQYLRVYRTAVAADSAYVEKVFDKNQVGDKKEQALRAVARTINRVDEIYESELGIRFVLVKNEDQLIFPDPGSDPFIKANDNANLALDVTQATIDKIIGENDYDIGHLFATGTAGLATLRSACISGLKAKATTGISSPIGDGFDVDYVAHEMGHQFGANHTFNGTLDACGANRRNPGTAFEPGSGSTIMSYTGPGLCGSESIQPDSDPYFHAASLGEIAAFLMDTSSGGSCGSKILIPSLDVPPVGIAPSFSYTVPKGTPFVLAPTLNFGRPLKFTWEEYDLGAPAPPDDSSAVRPLFRSRKPELIGTRYFPAIEYLSPPVPSGIFTAESLPQLNTTLIFRLTVRNGFGRFNYSNARINVDSGSGPFRLAQPPGGIAWSVGSSHTIVWDVANTDRPPVGVKNLRVSILPDADATREFTIIESVPNSGSVTVTIPNDTPITSNALLKLAAVGNIFFSIAPMPLQIIPK
jgi:hypothetical protein